MHTLDRIAGELRDVVAELDPATYAGCDAARLVEVSAEIERLGAAARVLFAKRAVDANAWRAHSHAATPEQWLATVSGCSEGAAREAIATARRVEDLPATQAALRDGSLSVGQATQVSIAATADPQAEARMLRVAGRGEWRNLTKEKERVIAAVTDDETAQRQAHERRHFRTWIRGFETHGSFSGPTSTLAAFVARLEEATQHEFRRARKEGRREAREAYAFDAFVGLAGAAGGGDADDAESSADHLGGETTPKTGTGTKKHGTRAPFPVARVRVDITRLLGLDPRPGDVCEIPGLGPVPASVAREVLSHGLLELVLHDGIDVKTVVTATRYRPRALQIALEERSECCAVQGCDYTRATEQHHDQPFAESRTTSYDILRRLCTIHHDLVTHRGYTPVTHPDGSLTLHAPGTSVGPPEPLFDTDPEPEARAASAAAPTPDHHGGERRTGAA
jgi:P2-related tail formation protein